VQEKIIGNKQRVLPVVENDKIVGVITRTDLLTVLVQQSQVTGNRSPDPSSKAFRKGRAISATSCRRDCPIDFMQTLYTIGQVATI
jgi:tRNA nucleotidyltransferase (CCA-adding enzyme)